jgi:hypothetical protein
MFQPSRAEREAAHRISVAVAKLFESASKDLETICECGVVFVIAH